VKIPKRRGDTSISLAPLTLDEALEAVLSYKPTTRRRGSQAAPSRLTAVRRYVRR